MISWLHTTIPSPILLTVGPVSIYWYGFLYFVSILLGYFLVRHQLQRQISADNKSASILIHELADFSFGLIVSGLIGARLYHVSNEASYYLQFPVKIIAVWEGGLAIHGALIAGALYMWWYTRHRQISFLWLADLVAPVVLLGQAIGRWGNYFNQELFGYPTTLPWGIPIEAAHRPEQYANDLYFHPTFLYESLWNFVAFFFLLWLLWLCRKKNLPQGVIFASYLVLYGAGRLMVELFRVDSAPQILAMRFGLLAGAGILCAGVILLSILLRPWKI